MRGGKTAPFAFYIKEVFFMGHCFSHLTKTDRYKIEALLAAKHTPREIADQLKIHISTVYREKKRARTVFLNSDLTYEERYNPDLAEQRYRDNLAAKGGGLKIGNDHEFAEYIERKIIDDHLSPAAALASIQLEGRTFKTTICRVTLYSYIEKGVFLNLTVQHLPVKPHKKRKYKRVVIKRPPKGDSIEKRPEEVDTRQTFGHWEMDTVYSGKKTAPDTLLVLTERLTREELIEKMPDRTQESTVDAFNRIRARFPGCFSIVFKTVTVDNGVEFLDVEGLERPGQEDATKLFFCHPYCSSERGSNENQNRMIRRRHPKGTSFADVTPEEIADLEAWINNYPRQLLGWKTSEMLFQECLAGIM